MRLPSSPLFKQDDFPELPGKFLEQLALGFADIYDAVARIPERGEAIGRTLASDASGNGVLELKNLLSQAPKLLTLSVHNDAAPDTAVVYGATWRMSGEVIRVSFVGLTASTKYRINVEYR